VALSCCAAATAPVLASRPTCRRRVRHADQPAAPSCCAAATGPVLALCPCFRRLSVGSGQPAAPSRCAGATAPFFSRRTSWRRLVARADQRAAPSCCAAPATAPVLSPSPCRRRLLVVNLRAALLCNCDQRTTHVAPASPENQIMDSVMHKTPFHPSPQKQKGTPAQLREPTRTPLLYSRPVTWSPRKTPQGAKREKGGGNAVIFFVGKPGHGRLAVPLS